MSYIQSNAPADSFTKMLDDIEIGMLQVEDALHSRNHSPQRYAELLQRRKDLILQKKLLTATETDTDALTLEQFATFINNPFFEHDQD